MLHEKEGFEMSFEGERCELQFLKVVGRIFHSLPPPRTAKECSPMFSLVQGTSSCTAELLEQSSLRWVLHKQAF